MYSACKLNKQNDNIQPWRRPFSVWNWSVVPCLVLNVASWPAYTFCRRQVKWKWSQSVMSNSLGSHDCSLPGSSFHGIFQARVLEWVAISFSRGSSSPMDQTWVSRIAGREAGKVVWYSHLFQNFPQFVVIYTVKGFSVVSEAEVDIFLELSCFFMIQGMLAIWSLVPLPFLKPAWTLEVLSSTTIEA